MCRFGLDTEQPHRLAQVESQQQRDVESRQQRGRSRILGAVKSEIGNHFALHRSLAPLPVRPENILATKIINCWAVTYFKFANCDTSFNMT